MLRTRQMAAIAVSLVAFALNVLADNGEHRTGDGSWLFLSSASLLHGTKGQAQIVVRNGNRQAGLDAPYEVVRHGWGGGTIKLRTSCGLMTFAFAHSLSGSTLESPDTQLLGKNARVSRCGLGERINKRWHLVAEGKSTDQ